MSPTIRLAIPIEVISQEEAEKADFFVCITADSPSPFSDNERGICSGCGVPVQFRPHAPKKPPRLCVGCVVKRSLN
jgi:hypothetical protein